MQAWDGADCRHVEGSPRTDLTDVPPEVLGVAVTEVDVELAHQSGSWIG